MAGSSGEGARRIAPSYGHSCAIVEDLLARPGGYAFVQAVDIAARALRRPQADLCRFRVNPSLAFPPADIESLSFNASQDEGPGVEMTLNLLGLHGADSPLPAYFTEHVAQHGEDSDPDPLRDFLDLFNDRIIRILHATWIKYRYYARYAKNAEDLLSQRFYGFIGVGLPETRRAKDIQWPRLMAYMGLIAMSGDAEGSLESILRHYFNHNDIDIIPCIRRWVPIPPDQQTRLGRRNCLLGEDFILGDEIRDQSGKFRIRVDTLDWQNFLSFLPCNDKFAELTSVVNFVLKSRLSFDVELRLRAGEIRPWLLGDETRGTLLGWSIWNSADAAGVVVLDADFGEL